MPQGAAGPQERAEWTVCVGAGSGEATKGLSPACLPACLPELGLGGRETEGETAVDGDVEEGVKGRSHHEGEVWTDIALDGQRVHVPLIGTLGGLNTLDDK